MSEILSELQETIIKLKEEIEELKEENNKLMHKIITQDIIAGKALSTKNS